jgi:hypothetical protein
MMLNNGFETEMYVLLYIIFVCMLNAVVYKGRDVCVLYYSENVREGGNDELNVISTVR